MANMPGMAGMDHGGMQGMSMPKLPENADKVPLFPQDAFMEGPMMAMDKDVDKPETYGLPPGWSGFVGGMMTFRSECGQSAAVPPGRFHGRAYDGDGQRR